MKFMDGTSKSAAEEPKAISFEVVIIFITNMAQYAIRGYAVDALSITCAENRKYTSLSQRLNQSISRG